MMKNLIIVISCLLLFSCATIRDTGQVKIDIIMQKIEQCWNLDKSINEVRVCVDKILIDERNRFNLFMEN